MNNYRKKQTQGIRPYIVGENLTGITISEKDTPELGGYVAVSGDDKWYVSKDYFDANYKLTENLLNSSFLVTGLSFGEALEALKAGLKVSRAGWNGKGMFIFLVEGSSFKVNRPPLLGIFPEGTDMNYRPHIDMKGVDGSISVWNPTNNDCLAEDWEIVDKPQENEQPPAPQPPTQEGAAQ